MMTTGGRPVLRDCFVAPLLAMTTEFDVIASEAKQSRSEWMLRHRAEIGGGFDHPVGEAPFVVVPREDPDEGLVEHLGLGHVERGTVRIVIEIDRHGRRLVD